MEEDIKLTLDCNGYDLLRAALPTAGALNSWHGIVERTNPLELGKLGSYFSWTEDHWGSTSPLWPLFYQL